MEKIVLDLLIQWGPPAGILLIVLYGAYRLVMYVLQTSTLREERLAGIIDTQAAGLARLSVAIDKTCDDHADIMAEIKRR